MVPSDKKPSLTLTLLVGNSDIFVGQWMSSQCLYFLEICISPSLYLFRSGVVSMCQGQIGLLVHILLGRLLSYLHRLVDIMVVLYRLLLMVERSWVLVLYLCIWYFIVHYGWWSLLVVVGWLGCFFYSWSMCHLVTHLYPSILQERGDIFELGTWKYTPRRDAARISSRGVCLMEW